MKIIKATLTIILILSFVFVPSTFARHHHHVHVGEIFATALAVGVVSSLVQPETVVEREVIVYEPCYVHPVTPTPPPPYPDRYYCPSPPPPPHHSRPHYRHYHRWP